MAGMTGSGVPPSPLTAASHAWDEPRLTAESCGGPLPASCTTAAPSAALVRLGRLARGGGDAGEESGRGWKRGGAAAASASPSRGVRSGTVAKWPAPGCAPSGGVNGEADAALWRRRAERRTMDGGAGTAQAAASGGGDAVTADAGSAARREDVAASASAGCGWRCGSDAWSACWVGREEPGSTARAAAADGCSALRNGTPGGSSMTAARRALPGGDGCPVVDAGDGNRGGVPTGRCRMERAAGDRGGLLLLNACPARIAVLSADGATTIVSATPSPGSEKTCDASDVRA
jgi:hypothetical protein